MKSGDSGRVSGRDARLAQWQSTSLTRKGSEVQILYRAPLTSTARSGLVDAAQIENLSDPAENEVRQPNLPNLPNPPSPRYTRIAKGIFQDRNGSRWRVEKRDGKTKWTRMLNGNHSIEVLPDNRVVPCLDPTVIPAPLCEAPVIAPRPDPTPNPLFSASTGMVRGCPDNPTRNPDENVNRKSKSLRTILNDYIEGRPVGASTREKFGHAIASLGKRIDLDQPAGTFDVMSARKLQTALAADLAPATVNDYFGKLLSPALALAAEIGTLARNPCASIKPVRSRGKQRLEPSWEDAHRLIRDLREHARNPKTADLIQTMLYLGIGQGEIKTLKGEHVDLQKREIHFVRQKTGKAFDIPIFDHALKFALSWKLVTGQPVIKWHDPERPFHFACDRLGMPRYTLRSLRRTLIVHLLEAGIEPRLVAEWQGHSDATMIIRIYGKNIGQEHRKAQIAKVVS